MPLLKIECDDKETIILALNRFRLSNPNQMCKCDVVHKGAFYRISFVDTKFVAFTRTMQGDKVRYSESYKMIPTHWKKYLEDKITN